MVINIAIKGGLGNQLFQYALGSYFKQKYDCKIFYDIMPLSNSVTNTTQRVFMLNELFEGIEFTNIETHKCFYSQADNIVTKTLKKIGRKINKYEYISETNIQDVELKKNYVYYVDGYWQNENIAKCLINELSKKSDFILKNNKYLNKIHGGPESVAIHVRRGDYIERKATQDYHGYCDLDYYNRAIHLIEQNKIITNYFVFSDDIEWAKANIKSDKKVTFVEGNDNAIIDLFLMKECKHQIIANSSFSCWASYLNINDDKIIIAPVNWTSRDKTIDLPISSKKWIVI